MENSLDKISISGFKSIRELKDFELKNLNVLIGGNGAGKSNFIQFFRLLQAIISDQLTFYILSGGGISEFLFNGRKITSQMEFKLIFGKRGYYFNLKPDISEGCVISEEARYYKNSNISWDKLGDGWWLLGDSPDRKSLLVKEAKSDLPDSKKSMPVYQAISSWQIYHFHDTGFNAPMRHAVIIQDNEYLRSDASNIGSFLLRLRNEHPSTYQEIKQSISRVMPFFDDFTLEVDSYGEKKKIDLSWRQLGSDYPMQPYHFSDGTIRFICLVTALLQPKPPSTIIIDEPELGLHPEAISVLAELIQDAAKRTQVIIATQSPALINNFSINDIIVVNRKDGQSTFERLNEKDFSEWLKDYSVGELWTKNVIAGGPTNE